MVEFDVLHLEARSTVRNVDGLLVCNMRHVTHNQLTLKLIITCSKLQRACKAIGTIMNFWGSIASVQEFRSLK